MARLTPMLLRSFAPVALALFSPLAAQAPSDAFTLRTEMIPARDGVKLHTEIYTPKEPKGPLAIVLERTPYGIRHDKNGIASSLSGAYAELARDGYCFVLQDIRGKYGSEGTFVMGRPPRADGKGGSEGKGIDEGTDTWDTIDWLVKNVPGNNGRVGMIGISYGGWLVMMALVEPHPALRAASPQASPDDMWAGDDFHHNGAFRLSYGFEYVASIDAGKQSQPFAFDRLDTFDWFLRLGKLGNVDAKHFHEQRPTWIDFVEHPDFDEYWRVRKVAFSFRDQPVTVPTLTVGGWWDQEDFYGPLTIYEMMEKNDKSGINHLVVGPWNHGGWARGDGASLGEIQFGGPTGKWYRENVQAKWFAYWLKDQGERDFPEALTFRAGKNEWQRHDAWPPKQGVEAKKLWLQAGGGLAFAPPSGGEASSSYVSDPAHPVPYRQRPIYPLYGGKVPSTWPLWLVDDQRHAQHRPDVLTFETETLGKDVTISGRVTARLFAATTGSDCDFVVKLIDVYPEDHKPNPKLGGWQLMVANDVFRARYRSSREKPEALEPGKVYEYAIDLHTADYTFLAGHRIMVQVQSTWFPLIDRNPQKFVPNIFKAEESDYVVATQRVMHSAEQASCVEVSVVK